MVLCSTMFGGLKAVPFQPSLEWSGGLQLNAV
jgi:hypothetical protein